MITMGFAWKCVHSKLGCNAFHGYLSSRFPKHRVLGFCPSTLSTIKVYVVFLDTLTPKFELYVRLRERRQGAATRVCGFLDLVEVEQQLDLLSVAARLRGVCWIDEEGLPDLGRHWSLLRNPE
ncbi:hypothetical protein Taro_016519 [Colocasia esculenta]|uniref:Uncharacterized protein n=1 Tax=Colocasia esculenta TaxID=4460 RepID=A0A843UKI6_COLES|nr:hypothetical protein [Colocasia esculenta]